MFDVATSFLLIIIINNKYIFDHTVGLALLVIYYMI